MRLANVNTTDIRAAVELGCRTMGAVFNADDNDIPFFASEVRPNPHLSWNEVHSESHVPGRHLNALLAAEAALGIEIPVEVVAKHAAAAYFSYGGPLPLPLNRQRIDGPLVSFNDHNLREGFHALYALARFRQDERALDVGPTAVFKQSSASGIQTEDGMTKDCETPELYASTGRTNLLSGLPGQSVRW